MWCLEVCAASVPRRTLKDLIRPLLKELDLIKSFLFHGWNMNEFTLIYAKLVHQLVYTAYWADRLYGNQTKILRYNLERISIELEKRLTMSKKVTGNGNVVKPEHVTVRWVNRQLTEEEKHVHDSAPIKPEKTFKDLLALALAGYNISVKWDAYSNCFQATLIPYATACANYGYGLSSRAAEPMRAISLLLYKHYEVLQEDWQQAYKPTGNSYEG